METLLRPRSNTNDPRQQHNYNYDTPEGHNQPLELMRNSMGNGAVGAAAGGELQPGRATGGATLTASRGALPQGDGQPPNDGALQVQDAVPHASSSTESDFVITDEDVMNAFFEIRRAEPGNSQMPARACGYDSATNQNEATDITGMLRQMQDQFKRREA